MRKLRDIPLFGGTLPVKIDVTTGLVIQHDLARLGQTFERAHIVLLA